MKKVLDKIVITGGNGLLGSQFKKKYGKKFRIISYPHRLEDFKKVNTWLKNKDFKYFIHFAAITKNQKINKKKINLVNVESSINLIKTLNKHKIKNFSFFLFISSSHVYGYSRKKIKEDKIRMPINYYGFTKKKVEDYIFKNRKKNYFKIGIARVFNFTGPKQTSGYFIPDAIFKIKNNINLTNINVYRDFVHIDDILESVVLILKKKFYKPINISSGNKINLIQICKLINSLFFKKNIFINLSGRGDIFGSNKKLRSLGKNKFKNINQIIKSYNK